MTLLRARERKPKNPKGFGNNGRAHARVRRDRIGMFNTYLYMGLRARTRERREPKGVGLNGRKKGLHARTRAKERSQNVTLRKPSNAREKGRSVLFYPKKVKISFLAALRARKPVTTLVGLLDTGDARVKRLTANDIIGHFLKHGELKEIEEPIQRVEQQLTRG
jgi:hypothetical protein